MAEKSTRKGHGNLHQKTDHGFRGIPDSLLSSTAVLLNGTTLTVDAHPAIPIIVTNDTNLVAIFILVSSMQMPNV